jgi:hypothetical protein
VPVGAIGIAAALAIEGAATMVVTRAARWTGALDLTGEAAIARRASTLAVVTYALRSG